MLDRPAISRVLQDLLRAEIAVSRGPAAVVLPSYPWPETLHIGADLGADSLELMALSGAVNEFFHLHDCGIEETLLQRRRLGDWVDLARQACMEASPSITFRSSGTTGAPKPIAHRLHGLAAEAAEHLARLDPGRILTAVPSHHIYGFIFGALMPSLAGCEVVNLRAGLPCRGGFRAGDVIVSVPEHWGFLARSFGSLPQLSGVTSTSPMHADLARDLTSGGLRLIEIYGSSETAGIGWRGDPDAPFTLLDRWQVASAPSLSGAPAMGALRVIDMAGHHAETPDAVTMAGPRSFHLQGRLDGAVQVGGTNVYPARIASLLRSHPAIARAWVRYTPCAHGGRLSAHLVAANTSAYPEALLRNDIEAWIAERLPPAARPSAFSLAWDDDRQAVLF